MVLIMVIVIVIKTIIKKIFDGRTAVFLYFPFQGGQREHCRRLLENEVFQTAHSQSFPINMLYLYTHLYVMHNYYNSYQTFCFCNLVEL